MYPGPSTLSLRRIFSKRKNRGDNVILFYVPTHAETRPNNFRLLSTPYEMFQSKTFFARLVVRMGRLIAMVDPEGSWVGKWQRIGEMMTKCHYP